MHRDKKMLIIHNKCMTVHENDVESALAAYGKTKESVARDVIAITEWINSVPGIPENLDDTSIERFLLRNKFQVQRTKCSIASYYNMKRKLSDYFAMADPTNEAMLAIKSSVYFTCVPKLLPNRERLLIFKVNHRSDLFNHDMCVLYCAMVALFIINRDYALTYRIIIDYQEFTWKHYLAVKPSVMFKIVWMYQEASFARIAGFEMLNMPSYFTGVFTLVKRLLKPKLMKRITFHNSLDSLYEKVPQKCLPNDFGGPLDSVETLHENTYQTLLEHREEILKDFATYPKEKIPMPKAI